MLEPITNPATKRQFENTLKHTHHALLITGKKGSGKTHIAKYLATKLLKINNISDYPFFLHIQPGAGIEEIRQAKGFTKRKTTGGQPVRRIILIESAEMLGHEAQNALLKLLEEPPVDTVIIMTCSNEGMLLPTIRSRSATLDIKPLNFTQLSSLPGAASLQKEQLMKVHHLSGGLAGLAFGLIESDDHELFNSVNEAKGLLRSSAYERLGVVETYSKDKQKLNNLLYSLERLGATGLSLAANKSDHVSSSRFIRLQKHIQQAKRALETNVNAKLVLTNLFLQM